MKQQRLRRIRRAVIPLVLSVGAALVLIIIEGKNPVTTFASLLIGGVRSLYSLGGTLGILATLLLASLSVAFAYRGGLYNLGASGQMLISGFVAVLLLNVLPLPRAVLLPLVLLAGMAAGAIWAVIPGLLRALFRVHEALSTTLMNFIAFWAVQLMPSESLLLLVPFSRSLRLPFMTGIPLHYGVLVAALMAVGVHLVLEKSVLGFEVKAAGANRRCAAYAGITRTGSTLVTFALAGALAGLAGVSFYGGELLALELGVLPSGGIDAIAIALIGSARPLGCVVGSLYVALLRSGAPYMEAVSGLPTALVDVIVALMVYGSGISMLMLHFSRRNRNEVKEEGTDVGVN